MSAVRPEAIRQPEFSQRVSNPQTKQMLANLDAILARAGRSEKDIAIVMFSDINTSNGWMRFMRLGAHA